MRGYDFHRQKPLNNYIVDFFCHELMLAIELDGLSHGWEDVQARDQQKEAKLEELGVQVLRFDDAEVMNDMENVLRVINEYIEDWEAGRFPS
jgi:very-short-patch-repair endonuclease